MLAYAGTGVWVVRTARSNLSASERDSERTRIGVNDSRRAPTISSTGSLFDSGNELRKSRSLSVYLLFAIYVCIYIDIIINCFSINQRAIRV